MNIKLSNTLTKQKDVFNPAATRPISLYVCGITPYDYAHIGHGRVYVTFDVLLRLLRFLGHKVTYVRNFTDIDDKLINKALVELQDITKYKDIADTFIDAYHQDMKKLRCLSPDYEPRVTECIPEIIAFTQGLIERKHAYVVGHDVYFDITSFPFYGKLSGRKLDDLLAGARVDVNEQKRHPGDFALWKGNNEKLYWQSPWGYGRPGWHIECSVMSKKHLGDTIDIHGGGMDLIFPHHENEVAQSEALHGKIFAHIWMHNAFVNINKEKMSKSLGNFITLHKIFQDHDPMILRFFYLQHHYRSPIDYSADDLHATLTAYKRLIQHLENVPLDDSAYDISSVTGDNRVLAMVEALADDLNTPKFLGLVFEHLEACKTDKRFAHAVKILLSRILGMTLEPIKEKALEITPEIQALIDAREKARKEKDWARADQIRDQLAALGYQSKDRKI